MNLTEYRKKAYKSATLPSGLNITIRRLSLLELLRVMKIMKEHNITETFDPSDPKNLDAVEALTNIVCNAVVSPLITSTKPKTPNALWIHELEPQDQIELFNIVFNFVAETFKDAESFRQGLPGDRQAGTSPP